MIRRIALLACVAMLTSSCAAIGLSGGCDGLEVDAIFSQVGDLVRNANVQSSDVSIGSVDEIELDGWNARVSMCLLSGTKVPANSRAVVRATSLLGEQFIDLQPRSEGPPYLKEGDVIGLEQTGRATQLEDVLAELSTVLGQGNLHQLNRFTTAQAKILRGNVTTLQNVLSRLRRFTGVLASRRGDIAHAVDGFDALSRTLVGNSATLRRFLRSFAQASGVLSNQRRGLQELLFSLDRFTRVSVRLLNATRGGLNSQLRDLRPILRTAVANSRNVDRILKTFATFSDWFPESMPGDYLQLDVCQAPPEDYGNGDDCPQAGAQGGNGASSPVTPLGDEQRLPNSVELILRLPLRLQ